MFCRKCGKEISDEAKFCPYCGATTSCNDVQPDNQVVLKSNSSSKKVEVDKNSDFAGTYNWYNMTKSITG